MLRSYLKSYAEKSTVHGVVYIGNSRSHIVEKIFWIISLSLSLIFTGLLIAELIVKFNRTPIIVSLDDTPIRVSEILFPSVTICPGFCPTINGTDYKELLDDLKSGQREISNFTAQDLQLLQVVSLLTNDDFLSKFNVSISTENFIDRVSEFRNFFHKNYYKGIKNARDNGNWTKQHQVNYTQIIGRKGFCYTFNFPTSAKLFNLNELSSDFNFTKAVSTALSYKFRGSQKFDYPLRTTIADLGLFAEFLATRAINDRQPDVFEYFTAIQDEGGYHFTFHHPFEIMSKDSPNYFAVFNRTTIFTVYPIKINYDDSIALFSLKHRLCYLPGEKSLKYFKVYNRINCEHECLANLTVQTCKCAQFFMVRNQTTKICGVLDAKCFSEVEGNFPNNKSKCECYESCERLTYDIESKVTNFAVQIFASAILEVKYNDDEFYQFLYKTPYTYVEVLGFVGGLLGLFAGLSALSVIEVIFFFSARTVFRCFNKVKPALAWVHPVHNEVSSRSGCCRSFLEKTSVHSFKFVATEDTKFKKLFWIAAFIISMCGFQSLAAQSYRKFSANAVALSQDSQMLNIDQIPFPAITLVGDFENSYEEYTWNIIKQNVFDIPCPNCHEGFVNLRTIVEMFVCRDEPMFIEPFNYNRNSDFVDLLANISSSTQRLWFKQRRAKWQGDMNPRFHETLTPHGIGYTFNAFDADKILDAKIVSDDFFRIQSRSNNGSPKTVPWSSSINSLDGFTVSLTNNSHLAWKRKVNRRCRLAAFLVHSPFEMPLDVNHRMYTNLLYGTAMEILIKPEIIKSGNDVRRMEIKHRKCYFEDEFKLKYFKHYQKSHCLMEVLSTITYNKCGCVRFNYVRNSSMSICDTSRWRCVVKQADELFVKGSNTEHSRHCLPLCNSIKYDFELITTREDVDYSDNSFSEVSLKFRFKDSDVVVWRRYQLYPAIAFLNNIGGLLGLFAGFSLLTLIETFYLIVFRPVTDLLRKTLKSFQ